MKSTGMLHDATEQLMKRMKGPNLTYPNKGYLSTSKLLERDEVLIINKSKQKPETGGASGLNVG